MEYYDIIKIKLTCKFYYMFEIFHVHTRGVVKEGGVLGESG